MAKFCARFPGMPYVSPAYATADHVIPFKLFYMMLGQLDRIEALNRWTQSLSVQLGTALANKHKNAARVLRDTFHEAFPWA